MFLLTLMLTLSPASAGSSWPMSEAIGNDWSTVIYGQAIDTVCESYSVDEAGLRRANYLTRFTIWEVVQAGETDDVLVEGETIQIVWDTYDPGPDAPSPESCSYVEWSISSLEVDIVALRSFEDGVAKVDIGFAGDADYETGGGVGTLPACGEDLQQEVLDDLDAAGSDEDDRSEADKSSAGCSVTGALTAGPLALVLALVGLARRRRE